MLRQFVLVKQRLSGCIPDRHVGSGHFVPEYGPVEGFDSVRALLGIGTYALGQKTLEQALQPISEQIDVSSVQTVTSASATPKLW